MLICSAKTFDLKSITKCHETLWQVVCIPGQRNWDSKTVWSISYQPSLYCNQITTECRMKMIIHVKSAHTYSSGSIFWNRWRNATREMIFIMTTGWLLTEFQVKGWERLGLDDIISVLQQNRLRWYGHVVWKEDNDWMKKCTHTHTHNRFTALLDFVRDYLGEPAPER